MAKRIVSLIIALLLVVGLFAGCNNSGNNGPKKPTKAVPDETVEITYGSTSSYMTTPLMWYDTTVMKKLQEMANVKITEYTYYDSDKYNILLSSKNLPDLVWQAAPQRLKDIIESKIALDLKPYLDVFTNINQEPFASANTIVSNYYGGEEKALYFLAGYVGNERKNGDVNNVRGLNIRWDWYKEAGAPEVNTIDDFIALQEKIVKAHPETEEGKKVYSCGLAGTSFSNWYTNGDFTQPEPANPWTFGGYLYMEALDDGELINGYTDTTRSAFWKDMYLFNELNKRGLLDPDSYTMTGDQVNEKVAAGQYVWTPGWPNSELYSAEKEKDPNTLACIICWPNAASMVFSDYRQASGYFPSDAMYVSADTKKLDGVLSLLNVVYTPEAMRMLLSGIEGEHWDYVDGVPTPKDEWMQNRKDGNDAWTESGINNCCGLQSLLPTWIHSDGYPVDIYDTDQMRHDKMNPVEADMAEFYGVDYPAQAELKLVEEGKTVSMINCFSELNQSCTETVTTDVQRILTQCNDILYNAVPALVGAADEAEFKSVQDKVLADLAAAKEADAWDWCKAANDKAQAFTKPITSKLDW